MTYDVRIHTALFWIACDQWEEVSETERRDLALRDPPLVTITICGNWTLTEAGRALLEEWTQ